MSNRKIEIYDRKIVVFISREKLVLFLACYRIFNVNAYCIIYGKSVDIFDQMHYFKFSVSKDCRSGKQ